MIFNKSNNGADELKKHLGFLYASNSFDNIKTDVMLAQEDMAALISAAVMTKAEAHYQSDNYGTGSTYALLDQLVDHIQLPIAYYAVAAYAAHTDVSHGDDGRKVVIDNENQKIAWQWMIDRDDESIINKAHKTTDRLIGFLETNANAITEWKDSDQRKSANGLMIPNAEIFNKIFPIDRSRRFFQQIVPFIEEAQRKHIKPVLGDLYADIKTALEAGTYTDADNLLLLIRVPLAYFALSTAARRLSVKMLPNGIFQDYVSDRLDTKARMAAPAKDRNALAAALYQDASFELENLQKELARLKSEAEQTTYTPVDPIAFMNPDNLIFRL